jgi:uncharacterized protein
MRKLVITLIAAAILAGAILFGLATWRDNRTIQKNDIHSDLELSIENIRNRPYAGSDVTIEQELSASESIVSYLSDGYRVRAFMATPARLAPAAGFPVIVYNHGLADETNYDTADLQGHPIIEGLVRQGYIVLAPDYRGHGESEGESEAELGYTVPVYTYDVMNLIASIDNIDNADTDRVGMVGFSMGGLVTLRSLTAGASVSAAAIIAGPVGTAEQLYSEWPPDSPTAEYGSRVVESFAATIGSPAENPGGWRAITPLRHLDNIDSSLQLHHGARDTVVPHEFTISLHDQARQDDVASELHIYPDSGHSFTVRDRLILTSRLVAFFEREL